MSDFQVPATFFEEVATSLWRKAPRVWRTPFATPYGTEDDVFRALCGLTERLDGGDASIVPRVYVADRPAGFSLDRHAARPEDGDLHGFERRLLDGLRGREIGMVIGDAAVLDDVLWRRSQAFLRGLYRAVGTPPGGAHAEVFFGNYQRSFFGVHKDRLETFTFVVRGRKRFLAWRWEDLLEVADISPDAPLHAFGFEDLDVAALRDKAVVLEGGPGDVLFWPASYWHVAEQVPEDEGGGGFVTTLTLALAPSTMLAAGSPLRLAEEGFDEAGKDGYYAEDPSFAPVRAPADAEAAVNAVERALEQVLVDPVFVRARRDATLAWLSTNGFKRGPDRRPLPELSPESVLVADSPILYLPSAVEEGGDDGFTCAANGILLQTLPRFLPLVDHLNEGGTFPVSTLVERFAGADGQPSEEDLVEALAHLVAARALRVI